MLQVLLEWERSILCGLGRFGLWLLRRGRQLRAQLGRPCQREPARKSCCQAAF